MHDLLAEKCAQHSGDHTAVSIHILSYRCPAVPGMLLVLTDGKSFIQVRRKHSKSGGAHAFRGTFPQQNRALCKLKRGTLDAN